MIKLLITIDTEAHRGKNPINDWIFGNYKNKEYGINKIMDLLDIFNFKGTFFLDIAEYWTYGDAIKEVGETILSRGHDLEMHIHPDHFTKNKNRLFLHQYSWKEQYNIINACTSKFKSLFGFIPVAFRAGKYGANYDTLNILHELGIKLDFSAFYANNWCKINPLLSINSLSYYDNIIEVPVTVFKSFDLLKVNRVDSISLDGCNFFEFCNVINNVIESKKLDVIVLMLHSFSFIRRDYKYLGDMIGINWHTLKKVQRELKFLNELCNKKLIENVTAQGLAKKIENQEVKVEEKDDYLPSSGGKIFQYLCTLERSYLIFGKNKKATLFILFNLIGVIMIATILLFFLF